MFHRHKFEIVAGKEVEAAGISVMVEGMQTVVLRMCRCGGLRSERLSGPWEEEINGIAKLPLARMLSLGFHEAATDGPVPMPADSD